MNTHTVSILVLSAVLGLPALRPLAAASEPRLPVAVHIQSVTLVSNSSTVIARGADFGDVFFAMKYKNRERLSPDVWVFHGFQDTANHSAVRDCRSVVVTFAQGKVADLQFVNRAAVTVLAANLRAGSAVRELAAR